MTNTETAMISIKNTLNIVNNSIQILRDFDQLLDTEGFSSCDSKIGCEPSKNMNQGPTSPGRFFPIFMSRYYYNANKEEESDSKLLGVNIQFYHHDESITITPALTGIVLEFPEPFSKFPPPTQSWWLKYMLYESKDRLNGKFNQQDYLLNGEQCRYLSAKDRHFVENMSFTYWGYELMDVKDTSFLKEKYVDEMVRLYNS